jgi:hypothetical protein
VTPAPGCASAGPRCALRLHAALRRIAVHRLEPRSAPAPEAPLRRLHLLEERAARERREHEALLAAAQALGEAAVAVRAEAARALESLGRQAVELALAIARELVGNAVDRGDADPLPAVLRCLDAAAGHGPVSVALAPADLERVMSRMAADPELRARAAACAFVADPALPAGHVRAQAGAAQLAHDPRELFARIAAELRQPAP